MVQSRYLLLALLASLLVFATAARLHTDYTIGEDYAIRASTNGVDATFGDLQGTVKFDADNLADALFNVSVATASINTGNKTQDKHARGDKWLDAEAHPRIRFVSTAFAKTSSGYDVTGNFTINGQTHAETIAFTFDGETFVGTTSIERERYGVEGPFLFGGLVGDEVAVELRVPVR